MNMITVFISADGSVRIEERPMPEPTEVAESGGLALLGGYVGRLCSGGAARRSLMVWGTGNGPGLLLVAEGAAVTLCLHVDVTAGPERELRLRRCLDGLGVSITRDYIAGNGADPAAVRCIDCQLDPDPLRVTAVCTAVLREAFGYRDEDGLVFTCTERS